MESWGLWCAHAAAVCSAVLPATLPRLTPRSSLCRHAEDVWDQLSKYTQESRDSEPTLVGGDARLKALQEQDPANGRYDSCQGYQRIIDELNAEDAAAKAAPAVVSITLDGPFTLATLPISSDNAGAAAPSSPVAAADDPTCPYLRLRPGETWVVAPLSGGGATERACERSVLT